MCRSTATENGNFTSDRDELKIRSFHLRFTISPSSSSSSSSSSIKLPETLTLVYLPRINGNPLEINGVKIRADAPSFVALHRARSMERAVGGGEAVYASVDRVRAGEAVWFEVYVGSQKAMKGVFRRGERGSWGWGLECKSAAEVDLGILRGEVLVGGERGRVLMREKVEMGRGERKSKGFCLKLEEIVEEGEREGCDCSSCCCDGDDGEDQEWEMVKRSEEEEEEEEEGVKWAVEMGIWVMFLGVGYLVSKASYRGLRRKRII